MISCPNCGKVAQANRELTRAKALYRAIYHWRRKRGADSRAEFAAICRTADSWYRADRDAGRPLPPAYQRID